MPGTPIIARAKKIAAEERAECKAASELRRAPAARRSEHRSTDPAGRGQSDEKERQHEAHLSESVSRPSATAVIVARPARGDMSMMGSESGRPRAMVVALVLSEPKVGPQHDARVAVGCRNDVVVLVAKENRDARVAATVGQRPRTGVEMRNSFAARNCSYSTLSSAFSSTAGDSAEMVSRPAVFDVTWTKRR